MMVTWCTSYLLLRSTNSREDGATEHDDAIHSSRDWKIQTIPKLDQYMAWVGTNLVDLVIGGSNVMQRYDNVMCRKNYTLVFYISMS
jgi:hypothetical protein